MVRSRAPYMCFLSHYKSEAGTDARYLKDLLQRMGRSEVYLDSSNLTNLTHLFDEGIARCDVVVLLCTEKVLTRPWCLLELFEAHRRGIPVVSMLVARQGFPSREANLHFLTHLETTLNEANAGAMATVLEYLRERDLELGALKAGLVAVLGLDTDDRRAKQPVSWHPWGSDNQVIADVMDLMETMAAATGRTLAWPKAGNLAFGGKLSASLSSTRSETPLPSPRSTLPSPAGSEQRMSRRLSSRRLGSGEDYAIFLSYYRAEAGLDARLLHSLLEQRLERSCFLDASCATSLLGAGLDEIVGIITHGIRRSRALVLVQTRSVLTRPFVLLEIYMALKLRLPIVPVTITEEGHLGDGYAFEAAKKFLATLEEQLAATNPGAIELMVDFLNTQGDSIANLQRMLSQTLPNIISIPLTPEGTPNHWLAVVQDILDKISTQTATTRQSKHRWHGMVPHLGFHRLRDEGSFSSHTTNAPGQGGSSKHGADRVMGRVNEADGVVLTTHTRLDSGAPRV